MDLYCQKCGEPWDHYYVEHEMSFDDGPDARRRFLNGVGCPACHWGETAPELPPDVAVAMFAMAELLGDDTDGMAAMMEDLGF